MTTARCLVYLCLFRLIACECPSVCVCQLSEQGQRLVEATVNVSCRNKELKKMTQIILPPGVTLLNLSGSGLTSVQHEDFANSLKLINLNLSHNDIDTVQVGAFLTLEALQFLDLSYNKLEYLNASILEGLKNLQELSLSYNRLKTLPEGLFYPAVSLRRVNFNSEDLVCDCNIQWLLRWVKRKKSILRVVDTQCSFPTSLKNLDVQSLKKTQLHCDWPVEVQEFEVVPSTGQVVFAGDSFPFACRVAMEHSQTKVFWLREGRPVESNKSQGIALHTEYSADGKSVKHTLIIERLQTRHSGAWKCQVDTPLGSVDKTVSIIVISENTAFCPPVLLKTNKGTFDWPKTLAGIRQEIPCDKREGGKAFYQCSSEGQWQELNLAQCKYTSIITRTLEELSVHDNNETSEILRMANSLQMLLSNPDTIQDKMDVVFVARILSMMSSKVPVVKRDFSSQIPHLVFNITSMMMNVSKVLLQAAQREDRSCSSILRGLEQVLVDSLLEQKETSIYMENIAAEARRLDNGEAFAGLGCTAYSVAYLASAATSGGAAGFARRRGYSRYNFRCSSGSGVDNLLGDERRSEKIEAFLHIPQTLFGTGQQNVGEQKILIIFYKNDNLFQRRSLLHNTVAPSAVLTAALGGGVRFNLTAPVVVGWQSYPSVTLRHWPAEWDGNDWTSGECTANRTYGNITLAVCHKLGRFALAQEALLELDAELRQEQAIFRALQVPFYVGTVACIVAMFVIITTYCIHFSDIRLSKKLKHCLINTCVCILLLDVIFAAGIRTRLDSLCKAVGIALHYLSICVVFWITVTSWNTYKKLTKQNRPVASISEPAMGGSGEDGVETVSMPPPKPMLKFYLFAWGIPIIICGITAAVNINFYNTGQYCFLAWDPSLLAFYGVVGLFVLINCLLFLCMTFTLTRRRNRDLSVPAVGDHDEVSPLHDGCQRHSDASSPSSINAPRAASVASSDADEEYRPGAQMAGIVLLLLLYILVWTSGALAIAVPFEQLIPNMEEIFGYMYMGFSIILGLFVVIFYCFARNDTRWRFSRKHAPNGATSNCSGEVRVGVSGDRHVHTAAERNTANPLSSCHSAQHHGSFESGLTLKSSQTARANSALIAAQAAPNKRSHTQLSNGKLVVGSVAGSAGSAGSCTPNAVSAVSAAAFYNPRQNGIAKKYWEKKVGRLHKMKQLTQASAKYSTDNESIQLLSPGGGYSGGDVNANPVVEMNASDSLYKLQRQRLTSAASEPPCYRTMDNSHIAGNCRLDFAGDRPTTAMYSVKANSNFGSCYKAVVHRSDNELSSASELLANREVAGHFQTRTLDRATFSARNDKTQTAIVTNGGPGVWPDCGTHMDKRTVACDAPVEAMPSHTLPPNCAVAECKNLHRGHRHHRHERELVEESKGSGAETNSNMNSGRIASAATTCSPSPGLSVASTESSSTSKRGARAADAADTKAGHHSHLTPQSLQLDVRRDDSSVERVAPVPTDASPHDGASRNADSVSPYACISVISKFSGHSRRDNDDHNGHTSCMNDDDDCHVYENGGMVVSVNSESPTYENLNGLAAVGVEAPLYENVSCMRSAPHRTDPMPVYENLSSLMKASGGGADVVAASPLSSK